LQLTGIASKKNCWQKSQQHRKSRLERGIKPMNIILYICTVDIVIRIPFPLPHSLT